MSLVKDAPHSDITYKIIGAAMEVHNKLGPGHKEIVYQKALSAKMLEDGLSFEEEKPIEIFIDDDIRISFFKVKRLNRKNIVLQGFGNKLAFPQKTRRPGLHLFFDFCLPDRFIACDCNRLDD